MKAASKLETRFREDCTVISMKDEYPGCPDEIKFVILTDLTETELRRKYSDILKEYEPYWVDSAKLRAPIDDFKRNEEKHRKRRLRNVSSLDFDERVCTKHLPIPSFEKEQEMKEAEEERLRCISIVVHQALGTLTEVEKSRLVRSVLGEKTVRAISEEDGCTFTAVAKTIRNAKKKMRTSMEYGFTKHAALSIYYRRVNPVSDAIASSGTNDK